MINSRSIDDLEQTVKAAAVAFIMDAASAGIDLRPICTFRDFAYQASLKAIGRTVKGDGVDPKHPMGRTVTNAGPGESWHNWRLAVDMAPFDADGKPIWKDAPLWAKIGAMGEKHGFEWGGLWKGVDGPHFQMRGGKTIAQMLAKYPHGLPNA